MTYGTYTSSTPISSIAPWVRWRFWEVAARQLFGIEQRRISSGVTLPGMPQSKETQDPTAERLLALNVQLTQVLCEAGIVRVRVQKACEANVWPTVPSFMPLKGTPFVFARRA